MPALPTFRLQIVSLQKMIFDADVDHVHLFGDEGEYDLLAFHYPLMGALPEGEVQIRGHDSIWIRSGVILFRDNRCTIICEADQKSRTQGVSWSDLTLQDDGSVQKKD